MKLIKLSSIAIASLIVVTTASVTPAIKINSPNILLANSQLSVRPSQKLIDAAIKNARKEWGLRTNSVKVVNTERTRWSPDCGNIPLPLCDVAVFSGYKITIASSDKQWKYFVSDSADRAILLARTPQNRTTINLPKQVMSIVLNMASKHLELSKDVLLIKKVERKEWLNMCFERALPNETCVANAKKDIGYRITIEAKPGEEYVYLVSGNGDDVRTEATTKTASRNDLLPNRWVNNLISAASKRFKIPSQQVYIEKAEQKNRDNYFWDVQISSRQGCRVNYQLDLSGVITKETPTGTCNGSRG